MTKFLFVYGSLLPKEIAFGKIERFVESKSISASIHGWDLYTKEGFPIAKKGSQSISGELLAILPNRSSELFSTLSQYEGSSYVLSTVTAVAHSSHDEISCSVYICPDDYRSPDLIKFEHGTWSSKEDPLIKFGIPQIRKQFTELQIPDSKLPTWDPKYWEVMIPLQGIFAVLSSVLQRLAFFVYGHDKRDSRGKVVPEPFANKLDALLKYEKFHNAFKAAQTEKPFKTPPLTNRRDPSRSNFDVPLNTLMYWYQVRNNLVHQGKDGQRDILLLWHATEGMLRVLEKYAE